MKTAIVTGVTGQDGSHMVDYLLANTDLNIIGIVRRLSVPNHKNLEHIKNDRFSIVEADICDSQSISLIIQKYKPDYFINFAANSFVGSSWDLPLNHMTTNCLAVMFQLEAIKNFAPKCRYYNAGSSEEFGDVLYMPQDENHPLRPRSPYGASKAAARHIVKVWRESYGLYAVQGWLFNHEGTRRGSEFVTRKITLNVARIKNEIIYNSKARTSIAKIKPLELGNLMSKRDWSDAEDFVEGVWLMLNQEKPKDYVLSSNETHTVREFVELAFNAAEIEGVWLGSPGTIEETFIHKEFKIPLVVVNPKFFRPAEVDVLLGGSDRARKDLNWQPKTSFFRLVKKMMDNDLAKLN
ncbi:MAG: GDP-mannose 4,6-dehydratase [Bacteroidetes bacterium]|nr:GDP-mannose 4,6-dehydratase [Bacteroidota bacterium]